MQTKIVSDLESGLRVDVCISRLLGISRTAAARLVNQANVTVNGHPTKPGRLLEEGDVIAMMPPEPVPSDLKPEAIQLNIVYEDDDLIVVDKPRGLAVHPGAGHPGGTLVNALLAHTEKLSAIGGVERPGVVHRLDMDTSGLLAVAKSDRAHQSLQSQIQARTARREYVAFLWGEPRFASATVDAAIGRDPSDRKKMAVVPAGTGRGRPAITELEIVERFGYVCLAAARLLTGRTHQIRVHCAYAGHPVVGDPLYGGQRIPEGMRMNRRLDAVRGAIENLHGQALHARFLSFDHPLTGERLSFEAPLPKDMTDLLHALRETAGSRSLNQRG